MDGEANLHGPKKIWRAENFEDGELKVFLYKYFASVNHFGIIRTIIVNHGQVRWYCPGPMVHRIDIQQQYLNAEHGLHESSRPKEWKTGPSDRFQYTVTM